MRQILTFSFIIISIFLNAQKITHYDGKITLDKNLKNIFSEFNVTFNNEEDKKVAFLLNKYSKIDFIKVANKKILYKEVLDSTLPDAKKIVVLSNLPKKFNLNISYHYSLDKIEFPTFKYNQNWIELSLYTAWFPLNFEDMDYSYDLRFTLPKNFEAISTGKIKKLDDNKIQIINNQNYKDILVVLSDKFQKFQSQNKKGKFLWN